MSLTRTTTAEAASASTRNTKIFSSSAFSLCLHGRKEDFCRFCDLIRVSDISDETDSRVADMQRQAFLKQAQRERERQARLRQAEAEARDKKKEEAERKKKLLEAAYDGDAEGIKEILDSQRRLAACSSHDVIARSLAARREMALVETRDANGNTCVSEAANSGACNVIELLLERGANVNSRGAYNRTPLFRAAFAGNEDAIALLLKNGADPRFRSDDGQTPSDVAATDTIANILSTWDLSATERKAAAIRERRNQANNLQLAGIRAEKNEIGLNMDAIIEEYNQKEEDLEDAFETLTQLRSEYDRLYPDSHPPTPSSVDSSTSEVNKAADAKTSAAGPSTASGQAAAASSGPALTALVREKLQMEINSAELRLEATKIEVEKIAAQLEDVRSNLRAKESEESQYACDDDDDDVDEGKQKHADGGGDARGRKAPNGESHICMNVQFRALEDVLIKDKSKQIRKSLKWPLLMDKTDRSATFLKYRDTNYVNALDPSQMKPNVVRIALLGAMRYGKPIVFDMMDLDRHGAVEATLEAIRPNLFQDLLDLSLHRDDRKIESLLKEEDGEEYKITRFTKEATDKFKCIFVTKNRFPAPAFLRLVFPIKID